MKLRLVILCVGFLLPGLSSLAQMEPGFSAPKDWSYEQVALPIREQGASADTLSGNLKCKCFALDSSPYAETACKALPIARCQKVGNIICYPKCTN